MVFERGTSSSRNEAPLDDAPLLPQHSQSQPLSSPSKSFGNILIAIVGAGVLGLPYTFMKTGWLAGIIMLGTVAGLTYYCMMLLLWTKRKLEKEGYVKIGSFGDVAFTVSGPAGKATVDTMIVLSQAGFCVSYLIFIGNSLSSILSNPEPMLNSNYPLFPSTNRLFLGEYKILGMAAKTLFIWACFPFQVGLNAIRTLTHLAPLSIFADAVDIAAMVVVMAEDIVIYLNSSPHLRAFTSFGVIPYGIGVAIYAFEGIGMVVPLEVIADKKHKFGGILGLAILLITLTYGSFGALGYFAYGDATRDIITLNLGKSLVTDLVQLALSINLFFTFPLMMNPVHEVVESWFHAGQYSFLLRSLSVFLTTLVALLVPNFADFLSLVGSSVCCVLGFVLPAAFHMVACRKDCHKLQLIADVLIIFFGAVFAILGTISSVKSIFSPE
uniref:TSA: Wollemia nobilis Ref_Wollemi_Transcript_3738_1690 transcribed RNA sequence n=1 Tax=Wollemia nobilis TaxID=56998 RepID=A0A0C9RYI7_9CONI